MRDLLPNLLQFTSPPETSNYFECLKQDVSQDFYKDKYRNGYSILVCKSYRDSPCKKTVRFADNCGGILEYVRIVQEPLDYPPLINLAVINRHKKAAKLGEYYNNASISDSDEENRPKSTWKLDFSQPASDYFKFLENLEAQKVALENCIVKNEECKMIGTIKVANITNEKLVNVRVTFDEWKTFQDLPATYQTSPSKNYDNFFFKLEIPSIQAERIEFCISYHANGTEYWDSNNGINYSLIRHNNDCV